MLWQCWGQPLDEGIAAGGQLNPEIIARAGLPDLGKLVVRRRRRAASARADSALTTACEINIEVGV